jgi:hypothetical protein
VSSCQLKLQTTEQDRRLQFKDQSLLLDTISPVTSFRLLVNEQAESSLLLKTHHIDSVITLFKIDHSTQLTISEVKGDRSLTLLNFHMSTTPMILRDWFPQKHPEKIYEELQMHDHVIQSYERHIAMLRNSHLRNVALIGTVNL